MTVSKPDTIEEVVAIINPEVYQALKTAVELGKWESGEKLSKQQIGYCLQAIIAYEEAHIEPQQRIGYIEKTPGGSPSGFTVDRPDAITSDRQVDYPE